MGITSISPGTMISLLPPADTRYLIPPMFTSWFVGAAAVVEWSCCDVEIFDLSKNNFSFNFCFSDLLFSFSCLVASIAFVLATACWSYTAELISCICRSRFATHCCPGVFVGCDVDFRVFGSSSVECVSSVEGW